jgi:hypothetical protein
LNRGSPAPGAPESFIWIPARTPVGPDEQVGLDRLSPPAPQRSARASAITKPNPDSSGPAGVRGGGGRGSVSCTSMCTSSSDVSQLQADPAAATRVTNRVGDELCRDELGGGQDASQLPRCQRPPQCLPGQPRPAASGELGADKSQCGFKRANWNSPQRRGGTTLGQIGPPPGLGGPAVGLAAEPISRGTVVKVRTEQAGGRQPAG